MDLSMMLQEQVCSKNMNNKKYYIGFVNSKVTKHILSVISPTLNYEVGQIAILPVVEAYSDNTNILVSKNISLSRLDWEHAII